MSFTEEQVEMFREDFSKGEAVEDGYLIKDATGVVKMPINNKPKAISMDDLPAIREILHDTYNNIIHVLNDYVDIRDDYKPIVATWIIGTYFHQGFNTYPYLFLNAMRGSGKTRLLKLIASMSCNGEIIGSPTEAVLFRIPKEHTLCIDEFEGIMRKGNEGIREMLNACYKKGMKVRRMKKKQVNGESEMVVEEFEPYKPICLANIWGMEEVLGDRCITMILEKSSKKDIMRILEDFDTNPLINHIKSTVSTQKGVVCSLFGALGYIEKWNFYIKSKYTTPTTHITLTTQTTLNTPKIKLNDIELSFFNRIDETGVNGRNLELFMPLLQISSFIDEEIFKGVLNVVTQLNKEKREEEMHNSKDVILMKFISELSEMTNFIPMNEFTSSFRNYLGDSDRDEMWINPRWVGRAMSRLNLNLEKRRSKNGIEIIPNVKKAKEKMEIFE